MPVAGIAFFGGGFNGIPPGGHLAARIIRFDPSHEFRQTLDLRRHACVMVRARIEVGSAVAALPVVAVYL